MDFQKIKQAYIEARKEERRKLKAGLKEYNDIIVKQSGNRLNKEYTSGKQLPSSYDLTNWLYIEVIKDDVTFLISFQPLETDPSSNNKHTLADRIGISGYTGTYNAVKVSANMMITDIDLPLNKGDIEKIYRIICEMAPKIKALSWKSISKEIS